VQFTDTEIDSARKTLGDLGLINGFPLAENGFGYLKPEITTQGRICVQHYDSDVAAYLERGIREPSVNYTNNITGSYGTQIAQGSPDASMRSTVNITDDHRQQLLTVTRQIAEQVDGLPPEAKPAAAEALGELQAVVDDKAAGKGKIRDAFGKIGMAGAMALSTEAGKNIWTLAGQAISSLAS
jgi:hypothetical protein